MALTEKMKRFCREYYTNGGNGTEAYLTAYDTDNRVTASREAHELIKRSDVLEYIKTLNIPQENQAISEREKKRTIIWDRINECITIGDDVAIARYMDILNKMDSEYININRTIDDSKQDINNLDTDKLIKLIGQFYKPLRLFYPLPGITTLFTENRLIYPFKGLY